MFQFWSAYVPCSSQHLDSVQLALEQIDLIRRLVNKHPESMVLVTTAEGGPFPLQFYAFVALSYLSLPRLLLRRYKATVYTTAVRSNATETESVPTSRVRIEPRVVCRRN